MNFCVARYPVAAALILLSGFFDPSQGLANECDNQAASFAKKIGATVGIRGAGDMIALHQSNASEITYGCPPPKAFLVIFGNERPLAAFLDFLGFAGNAFTGEPEADIRMASAQCIAAAKADRFGSARLPFGKFILDCGAAPKVTFEDHR